MTRRYLIASLLLVLIVGICWWLLDVEADQQGSRVVSTSSELASTAVRDPLLSTSTTDRREIEGGAEQQPASAPQADEAGASAADAPIVVVRVLDSEGTPLVGEVVHFWHSDLSQSVRQTSRLVSDAQGEVRHEIRPADIDAAEEGQRFFVRIERPSGSIVESSYDPRQPPEAPIELRALAGGHIHIVVIDAFGEVYAPECQVEIALVPDSKSEALHYFANLYPEPAVTKEGRWSSPPLRFGLRWSAAVTVKDGAFMPGLAVIDGPTTAQPNVEVRMALGAPKPVIYAQLCDTEGKYLAKREWGASVSMRSSPNALEASTSDGEGWAHWALPMDATRATQADLWMWSPLSNPTLLTRHALPVPMAAGAIKIPDLQVPTLPIGIKGVVLDGKGAAVSEAFLSFQGSAANDAIPYALRGYSTRTNAAGEFAFCVVDGVSDIQLKVEHGSYAPLIVEHLAPGSTASLELKLTLKQSGEMRGGVLLDDPQHADLWRVELREAASGKRITQEFVSKDGFYFTRLPPGQAYHLRFLLELATFDGLSGSGENSFLTMLELKDLSIPEAGGLCDDPRLTLVDLRGLARMREVLLVYPDRSPYANQQVGIAARQHGESWLSSSRNTDREGRFRWLAPRELEALHIGAKGYAIAQLEPALEKQTVTLVRGLPVVIEMEPGAPEIPEGFEISPTLRHEKLPELWCAAFHTQYLDFEAPMRDGRAEIFVAGPGIYRVSWQLSRQLGGTLGGTGANVPRRDVVEVLDTQDVQRFKKSPHPNGVKAALRAFENQR